MNIFSELVTLTGLTACLYVVGASVCRLRHGSLSYAWATLYTAVMANALWTATDIIGGDGDLRDALIALLTAAYLHLTRRAWSEGVPSIAQKSERTP